MPVLKKGGLIPFFYNEDTCELEYLFMISSDANFGGPDPMISKGGADPEDASIIETAIREAVEELGLKKENMAATPFHFYSAVFKSYSLDLFAVRVKSKEDFGTPCFETETTVWMTQPQFEVAGRKDHRLIVKALERQLFFK